MTLFFALEKMPQVVMLMMVPFFAWNAHEVSKVPLHGAQQHNVRFLQYKTLAMMEMAGLEISPVMLVPLPG